MEPPRLDQFDFALSSSSVTVLSTPTITNLAEMAFQRYFTNMGGFWSNPSQHGLNLPQIAPAPAPRRLTGLVDLPNEILEMICLELGDDGMGTTTRRRDLVTALGPGI